MTGYIGGIDWVNIEPMKYWAFSTSTPAATCKETVQRAIFGGEYIGALKVDGYYQRIIKDDDGNCFMIARSRDVNGNVVNKIDWVPHLKPWFDALPNGTCLLCECYLPGKEGSNNITSILGCLKEKAVERQKKTPLHLYVFDVMAWGGGNEVKTSYEERTRLVKRIETCIKNCIDSPYVEYAEFYEGAELWDKLQEYLAAGREGCVIMRKDAIVYNKRTPARISIKIKKELQETIDAIIMGANEPTKLYGGKDIASWQYWVNPITGEHKLGEFYFDVSRGAMHLEAVTKAYYYGWAGSLIIGLYDDAADRYVQIGSLSGITEEILSNWRDYVGKVVEITGMQTFKDDNGKVTGIRHPKMLGLRPDKEAKECLISQLQ